MTERADRVTGDPHDLVAGYLLDALDTAEATRFAEHLPSCAPCRTELALLAPTVADLASTVEVLPPAAVEASLMSALFGAAQVGSGQPPNAAGSVSARPDRAGSLPVVSAASVPAASGPGQAPTGRRRRWMWPAAAVAAFVLGVGVATSTDLWRTPPSEQQAVEAEMHQIMEITAAPDAHVMPLDVPGATTRLVISDEMDKGAVLASDLPMPAKGREYHLWSVVDEGTMLSAATFVPDPDGHVSTMMHTSVRDATAFMLTVEEPGAANPTASPIAEVST